jgi:DNA-binding NarL/FixJ family response regulator
MNRPAEQTTPDVIKLMMANLPIMLSDLLQSAFGAVPDIQVADPAHELKHLVDRPKTQPIDVILLGSSRVDKTCSAITFLDSLPDHLKSAKVLVLSQDVGYSEVISLFRAGVRGIFSSESLRFDLLCKSVRCVHQGEIWANNELLAHLVTSLSHPKSTDVTDIHGRPLLTRREQEVLHLLADGLSNYELAAGLRLSEHTIKNHLFRIYDKLGVSNRMEAVLYALTPRYNLPSTPRAISKPPSSKIRMIKTG